MKTSSLKKGNRRDRMGQVLLRSGAVIFSVVLLSFTVSAQGLWKQLLAYNSFGKMAILMVRTSEAGSGTEKIKTARIVSAPSETAAFRLEPASDRNLEVEPWMTDDLYFGAYNRIFEVEKDKPLDIELWMVDSQYFAGSPESDKDRALQIESWMVDDRYWRY